MPRKQKQHLSREMIERDIAAAHRKILKLKTQAAEKDAGAEMAKLCGEQAPYEILSEEAEKLWKKAERVENTRLKKLGLALSAFLTKPMFGEEGVVLQKV